MNQDQALKKALSMGKKTELPFGFENRLMNRILLVEKKRAHRLEVMGLCLVSAVSMLMIFGTVLLLKYFFPTGFSVSIFPDKISDQSLNLYAFFSFISLLVLILLIIDTYFRKKKQQFLDR